MADPRKAEYRKEKRWCERMQVELVYKRVLLAELIGRIGLDNPVLLTVQERPACMVNSPRSKSLHKKASLAVLSDERNAALYDAAALAAIQAFVPWTRVVEERRTTHGGAEVDLVAHVRAHRDRMILK